MRWAFLALIVLVGACAAPTTPQARASSPASSPNTAPTPGSTNMPITQLGFACRMPFLKQMEAGHWQAGFLSLPSGVFTPDVSAPPVGYYDRAVSK
ncbi:MAG: hypothetical protein M3R21_08190, partial [Candidatus Dormibacteraeota bacterium]|nr:hypothetical protein [Candidatus Dormibacteraeota bacterium]